MITVLRASGLSVVIYKHDHEPPHVHVIGDGEVRSSSTAETANRKY
jgi:hypothetical protein